jgi:hypothetical protein
MVVAFMHHLAQVYPAELMGILDSPVRQIGAMALLLTALAYLVVLSLPVVPNLRLRHLGIVVAWAALLSLALYVSDIGLREARALLVELRSEIGILALVLMALAYAVCLAMPFVPGMEVGVLIMVMFGPPGIVVVYVATLLGLSMAYLMGQILPAQAILARLKGADPGLHHQDMASTMPAMLSSSRFGRSAPPRLLSFLGAHRHLALAVCLNLPGNTVLGGGGGIALLCGMSRQFGWRAFLLTIAIATSPVPILMLTGMLNLDPAAEPSELMQEIWIWLQRLIDRAR